MLRDARLDQSNHPIELRRVGNNLPSRVADNFFWLGRYAERAEAAARILRSTFWRFNAETEGMSSPVLLPLLQTLCRLGHLALPDPADDDALQAQRLEGEAPAQADAA